MQGTTAILFAYYFGGGFVILLGWAACLPNRQLDPDSAQRYLRRSTIAATIGLLHPAIALAARDIVAQVGIEAADHRQLADQHARATSIVNVLAAASALPVAAALGLTWS